MNLNHYADQPKLRRELQNLRQGKRPFAHPHLNPFYVFWLLLFVILFCAPAVAEPDINGTVCEPPDTTRTVTIINADGSKDIKVCLCKLTRDDDEDGYPIFNWVCG
jgi:hypothetical protein